MTTVLNRKVVICILVFLAFIPGIISGQIYRFRNYGLESRIPDGFIYTINQDRNGYLWVGTGSGISKFDGFDFRNVHFPDSSAGRYATASLTDSKGNIWFGCNDGSICFTDGSTLKSAIVRSTSSISAILEGPDKNIYVFPQARKVFRINPDNPDEIKDFNINGDLNIFSACFTETGNLVLGTSGDIRIFRIDRDTLINTGTVEGFDYSNILSIYKVRGKDVFLAGTDGNGLFNLEITERDKILTRFPDHRELDPEKINSITEDLNGNFWISTNNSGVIEMKLSDDAHNIRSLRFLNKTSGLQGNSIRLVFQDIEGNYWFGLIGDGLAVLNSMAYTFFSPGTIPENNSIIYIKKYGSDYFLGTPSGFYHFDADNFTTRSFTDLRPGTGRLEISSYFIDNEDNIWIGTRGGGLYVRNAEGNLRLFYRTYNSGKDNINDIEVDKKHIWLGTLDGVIILSKNPGDSVAVYNIDNGLPHNSINKIFLTSDGKGAIATKTDRLYLIDPGKGVIPGKAVMYGTTMNEIYSFCESSKGSLWATTSGNGIFEFAGDSLRTLTRNEMLFSDFGYSILADSQDRIWIGHASGFSRYNLKTGSMNTFGSDYAKGGICNPGAMYESPEGKIFIGTTAGLILYDRAGDQRPRIPPFNNINSITINDKKYPLSPQIVLPYNKRYSILIDYVGINFSDPEKVWYQTRMDGLDNSWSKLNPERRIPYSPRDGKYRFLMRSVNDEGLTSENPVFFDLIIRKPVWRTWWFMLSSVAIISGIVILIVREREREQKKVQQYLEKELEARTSVVLKQKGEIELANLEITDSINYAKRIQSSILPDFNRVRDAFSDAFLIFRPRDIVSGDFYWFDKIDEDHFMIVCADSTGHGVPGAFMSMIGSTLLQDIVKRQHVTTPSEVLKMLDKQIFSTLNQNIELGVSNDGMDMVVCEVNIKNRHIRFASAMRPVILVLDGEPFYIKGNRSSVGGESVIEKYFDDQEYYLNSGDTIYMFSDGLPDQFGGTDGKKLKIARLKKLIEDVFGLPMNGQKEVIIKFYDEWKGDYEQVDDILMMGVRL